MSNLADALGAKAAQKPLSSSSSSSPPASTARNTAAAAGVDSPVPVVDFAAFAAAGEGAGSNDEEAKKRAARQIDDALRTVGFVYLQNHGVDAGKVKEMFEWSHRFFSLPTSTKQLAPHPPGGSHHRGYSAPGVEKVTQHTYGADTLAALRAAAPDVKESFECGNAANAAQPNIWPPEDVLPGFREGCMRFFDQGAGLVHRVLRALGLALAGGSKDDDDDDDDDAGVDALSNAHAASAFQLRLLHYPSIPTRLLRSQAAARIGAHSDFGSLTLLFQDSVGGLEIESPHGTGTFRAAPPVDGAVLVNVGDLLERWSNGRWRSTVHRVGMPAGVGEGEDKGKEEEEEMCPPRYSIPFFAAPDPQTLIEALPGCWDEAENPKKYPPVTAEEYVTMRMSALY
ncbi:thymine dioxygenase [Phyllosticta capitalensis]